MESLNVTAEHRAAMTEVLQTKDMDYLRGMLAMVYDASTRVPADLTPKSRDRTT